MINHNTTYSQLLEAWKDNSSALVDKLTKKLGRHYPESKVKFGSFQHDEDPHLAHIVKHGQGHDDLHPDSDRIANIMPDNKCHWNAADLHKRGHIDHIVIGYARNRDGRWLQHTWGSKEDKTVETTPSGISHTAYFGVKLNKKQSEKFSSWTRRPENFPGAGRTRRHHDMGLF